MSEGFVPRLRDLGRGSQRERARVGALEESERWFRALVEHAPDPVLVIGHGGVVHYASPAITRLLGHEPDRLADSPLLDLVPASDRGAASLALAVTEGETRRGRWAMIHRDSSMITVEGVAERPAEAAPLHGVVLSLRVAATQPADRPKGDRSFYDDLTGLPTRALFEDRATHAFARARRAGQPVAILVVDLEDMGAVNDVLGSAAGDELLLEVARRLDAGLRAGDTGARVGENEFAVLLEGFERSTEATEVARRLVMSLSKPVKVGAEEVLPTACVGVAVADDGGGVAMDLLRDAGVAAYAARARPRRPVRFEPAMRASLIERLEVSEDLALALERDQLEVLYQPLVDLGDERIVSAEALLRWHHPRAGVISPVDFIPLAEESAMIVPIGRHVVRAACVQLARWQEGGRVDERFRVSVNLSGRELRDPELTATVRAALEDEGVAPGRLMIEVTETAVLADLETARVRLSELRALGVGITLDDYGAGRPPIAHVYGLPVDEVKVETAYVGDTAGDGLGRAVTRLRDELGIGIVAKGIEEREQVDGLRALGCSVGQGFLFAPPLTAEDLTHRLGRGQDQDRPAARPAGG